MGIQVERVKYERRNPTPNTTKRYPATPRQRGEYLMRSLQIMHRLQPRGTEFKAEKQLSVFCGLFFLLCSHVAPKKRQTHEETEYEETPQEKKLRLAKLYLDQLKEEGKLVLFIQRRGPALQCVCSWINLLFTLVSSEETKAEEDSFETDLVAGRLQEEVVSVCYVQGAIATCGTDMTPSFFKSHFSVHQHPCVLLFSLASWWIFSSTMKLVCALSS